MIPSLCLVIGGQVRYDTHEHWDTLESYINLAEKIEEAEKKYNCILLDCITLLLTNLIFEYNKTDDIENMDFIELENKIVKKN